MKRGFSLLEVMMAIAILGLSLTVILSAQGGISAGNRSAANMGRAITAARCKMSEIELKLLKNGYSLFDEIDTDARCCEDVDESGVTCDTRVEKIELPNLASSSSDGGAGGFAGLAALAGGGDDGGLSGPSLNLDGGIEAIGAGMQGQMAAVGGSGGIVQTLMGFVYPTLKPTMEASIRRVTVVVRWKEGPNARDFSIVQYVTNPQLSGLPGGFALGLDGGVPSDTPGGNTNPQPPPVGGTGVPR